MLSLTKPVSDPDLFRFILLLNLTRNPGDGGVYHTCSDAFSQLHDVYLRHFERRLASQSTTATTTTPTPTPTPSVFKMSNDETLRCVLDVSESVKRLVQINADVFGLAKEKSEQESVRTK